MNLVIRHSEPSDAEALHRVFTSPRAVWGTLQLPYSSVEVYRKRIAERPEGMYQLVALADGELAGAAGLHTVANMRLRHTASIGMAVRDDWQGKGVGSALMREILSLADNWLNLKRVELEVYTDNPAAIALYTKFGFEHEGTKRAFAFRDGQYVDAHMMARVR